MVITLIVLVGAAILEVGGDALIRMGLHGTAGSAGAVGAIGTIGCIAAGAIALTAYGIVVNQGALNFGRLMGAYIAVFFVVSQIIAFAIFHQPPSGATMLGGALIVAGGAIMMA